MKVFVTTNYNAEIEAMRNGKLEIGEFGPLGYVLAHQVAKAEAVAAFSNKEGKPDNYWASLVTCPELRHQDGGRYPRPLLRLLRSRLDLRPSVPGLWAAQGRASIPTRTSRPIYAGSHTSSFEALYNHKVDAGELNSEQLESANQRGHYKDGDVVFLWKSDPIPTDPITVRGDLPEGFKAKTDR